jgi:molecular chaperone DnaJ
MVGLPLESGGSIEVPTLNGKLKIKIPEGTQTDKQFRLKSKGITGLQGSGTGDNNICFNGWVASRI